MAAAALAVAAIVPLAPARALMPYQGWTPSSFGMLPECGKYETSGYAVSGCLITRRMRFHPSRTGVAVAGTLRQGPWITTNGLTWTPLAPHCLSTLYTVESAVGNGLTACGVEDIAFDPVDPQTIYVTAFNFSSPLLIGYNIEPAGVFRSTDLGLTWQRISPPIRGAGLAVIRSGSRTTIMAGQIQHTDWDIGTTTSLIVSDDGGGTWRKVTLPAARGCNRDVFLSSSYLVASIVPHPTNPNLIYAATNGGVYMSTNRGSSWSLVLAKCISTPVDIGMIWGLTISPDGKTVFAGLWDGTIRMSSTTRTSTRTWKHVTTIDGTMISHLMPDMRDPTGKTLYVAALNKAAGKTNTSAGVYRIKIGSPTTSTLLWDSWASGVNHAMGSLPRGPYNLIKDSPAFWLAQNPVERDLIYLSQAAGGIFWRSEGPQSPSAQNPGLPALPGVPAVPTSTPSAAIPTATGTPRVPYPTSTPTP